MSLSTPIQSQPRELNIDASLVPLSKSDIWKTIKDNYIALGTNAWKDVPFQATNNPSIAQACSRVVMSFIKELVDKKECDPEKPFYILEFGSGLGRFAFYMLQQIKALQPVLTLHNVNIIYVMSDMVQKNIDFWRAHPALTEFVNDGRLDFAHYIFNSDEQIQLMESGEILKTDKNPLILIANYFFDSLPQDIFSVKDNTLYEGVVSSKFSMDQPFPHNVYVTYEQINFKPVYLPIDLPYYNEPFLNTGLQQIQSGESERYYLFPNKCLQGLDKINKNVAARSLLFVNDKGFGNHQDLYARNELGPTFHGKVLSFPVDYGIIGNYCQTTGGSFVNQSFESDLSSVVFSMGFDLQVFNSTVKSFTDNFDGISPGDLCNINAQFWHARPYTSLDGFLSIFKLNRWDPETFSQSIQEIINLLSQSHISKANDLVRCFPDFERQFYRLPDSTDLYAHFSAVYMAIQMYEQAIPYLYRSINEFGEQDTKYHNLGICYYSLKDYKRAEIMFKKTLKLNKNDVAAKGWLSYAQEKLNLIATPVAEEELR